MLYLVPSNVVQLSLNFLYIPLLSYVLLQKYFLELFQRNLYLIISSVPMLILFAIFLSLFLIDLLLFQYHLLAKFSLYSTSFLRSSATIFSGAFSTKPLFDNFFCTNVTSFCHFSFSFSKRATSFSKSIKPSSGKTTSAPFITAVIACSGISIFSAIDSDSTLQNRST